MGIRLRLVKTQIRKLMVLALGTVALGFHLSSQAYARGEVPIASGTEPISANDPRAQIYGDPNFKSATQSQFHSKANQNITLQVDYLLKKIDFLDQPAIGSERSALLKEKYRLLGGFCGPVPKSQVSLDQEDELNECISDYKLLMKFWEVKAFKAIGENNEAIARLQCSGFRADGTCIRSADGVQIPVSADLEKGKREQLPALATAEQLARLSASRADTSALSQVTDAGDLDWERKMFDALAPDPNGSDFKQMQKVQTLSGVLQVSKNLANSQGSHRSSGASQGTDVDTSEFEASKKVWGYLRQRLAARFKPGTKVPSLAEIRRTFIEDFKKNVPAEQRSVGRWLYDQARGENVDLTNLGYVRAQNRINAAPKPGAVSSSSKLRSGGVPGKAGNSAPQFQEETISLPATQKEYQGNEEVVVPVQSSRGAGQALGESSVTYDPASRPDFRPDAKQLFNIPDK